MLISFAAVKIPDLNIISLMTSGAFCVFGPLVLYLLLRKKFALAFIPFVAGAAGYMAFVLLIENQISYLATDPDSPFYDAMIANPALYMLYAGFSAGLIEEGGRYAAFYALKKWFASFSTPVSFALGYSSIESIFMVGARFFIFAWLAINHNAQLFSGASNLDYPELFISLSTATPIDFLAAGLERFLFTGIYVGLSTLVWYSVTKPGSSYLFFVSVLLHAMFLAPVALKEIHVINSIPLYYVAIAACSLISLLTAFFIYRADIRSRSKTSDPFAIF